MDPTTVDNLARLIGSGQSRRRILKTLTGGALGALTAAVGLGEADARGSGSSAPPKPLGAGCTVNADCGSNVCTAPKGRGAKVCVCGAGTDCPQPTGQCQIATCAAGVCGVGVNVGAGCSDGNACTTGETCQPDGSCGGGTVTVCTASDQCHDAGTCDAQTGACSNPAKPDGTACDDSDASTCHDVCTGGSCAGTPVNLNTDNANCGTCGNVCSGTGQTCGGGGTAGVCGCIPNSLTTTCRGHCGETVTNNCGQSVTCGACMCGGVPEALTCPVGYHSSDCSGICFCTESANGGSVCINGTDACDNTDCTSDSDCSGGKICAATCCTPNQGYKAFRFQCARSCGAGGASVSAADASAGATVRGITLP